MAGNIIELFEQTLEYAIANEISKVVIFAKESKNAITLNNMLSKHNIDLTVTTFAMNSMLYLENDEGEIEEFYPEINNEVGKRVLENEGIRVVASTLPLDNIVVPGTNDSTYNTIKTTLNLFGEGIDVIVQAAMMAVDNGAVTPGERIIALNAVTAVDLETCNSRYLFHPSMGLKVHNILK